MDIPGSPFAIDTSTWSAGPWWTREAIGALARGHCQAIPSRDGGALYLLRLWLSAPRPGDDGRWDSADSLLLHRIVRADDDESLHDHPWDFRTTILAGNYVEHLPPADWCPRLSCERDLHPGPAWNERVARHPCGAVIHHHAADLHCIGSIAPITWTLLRTGAREREWGFHPPGKPWVHWRTYLNKPALAVAP